MVAALVMPPEKLAHALLTGKEAEHYVPDPEMPGHGVRLRQKPPRGELRKTFEGLPKRIPGVGQRRLFVGDTSKFKIKDSRIVAHQWYAKAALGQDPTAEKKKAVAEAKKKPDAWCRGWRISGG